MGLSQNSFARRFYFLLFPLGCLAANTPYEVRFLGLPDSKILQPLQDASDLVSLKDRPPASINGLRYRVQNDIPNLLNVLKAFAYYDAEVSSEIEENQEGLIVYVTIHPGPQYVLASYEVYSGDCTTPWSNPLCQPFCPALLGLQLNQPASSQMILTAEKAVLEGLSRCGYPLAYLDKRRVVADMSQKTVDAAVCVQEGPVAHFGPLTYFGLKSVSPHFLEEKIAWKEGDLFDSSLIDETQRRLLKTSLFSTVLVTHSEELDAAGELSMKIRLSEAKHKTFSLGAFYGTVDGPGGIIGWKHRNLRGMGEEFSFELQASMRSDSGTMIYSKPDFGALDQTLSVLGQAAFEDIKPYLAKTLRASLRLQREIDARHLVSATFKVEEIQVSKSANNGNFSLVGLPIFVRYAWIDSPIDPMKGWQCSYTVTPYQSMRSAPVHFVKQQAQLNLYFPLLQRKITFALTGFVGSLAGSSQAEIPLPKLFLGGSEDNLRGYTYMTVSPLSPKGRPLGGRSAIFSTAEMRFRVTKIIGLVPFMDFGTVSLSEVPQIDAKWYKSIGLGLRYYTFFGPLRLDYGYPLNRRSGLDTHWGELYASVGQSF